MNVSLDNRRLIKILLAFIAWQLILLAVMVMARMIVLSQSLTAAVAVLDPTAMHSIWRFWDADIFQDIAAHGYRFVGSQADFGFWPLWPIVLRTLTPIFGSGIVAGIVANQVFTFLILIILYRLIRLDHDEPTASRSVWWLMLWPTNFMLTTLYSDSLFLLLVLLAFYAARRSNWWWAGIMGGLTAATRHVGALLIFPLAAAWWSQPRKSWRAFSGSPWWLALIAVGAAAFPLYGWLTTGRLLVVFDYQRIGLQHPWSNPLTEAWRYLAAASHQPWAAAQAGIWLLAGILVTATIVIAIKKILPASYAIYSALLFLFPMFSASNLIGIPRYSLALWPMYLVLALKLPSRTAKWVMLGMGLAWLSLTAAWALAIEVTL